MNKQQTNITDDQGGFASVVVALVIIIVLALVTIGFAKLARQEQENALDKQLTTQAYYAAESGINDALFDIKNKYITSSGSELNATQARDDQCFSASYSGARTKNQTIDPNTGVFYSCLLVNLQPDTLEYKGLEADTSRATTFSTTAPLNSLAVEWKSAVGNQNYRPTVSGDNFMRTGDWSSPGVLQFSVTPLSTKAPSTPTADNTTSLSQQSFTVFMYPSKPSGSNTVSYSVDEKDQGKVVSGNCSIPAAPPTGPTPYDCKVTINGITNATKYLITILNYYNASDVRINGNGSAIKFTGGQAEIDVTGKARNVLKRLKVRIPIDQKTGTTGSRPNYALEAQNICKRIKTNEDTTSFDTPPELRAWIAAGYADSDICELTE